MFYKEEISSQIARNWEIPIPYTSTQIRDYLSVGLIVEELCKRGYEDRICSELIEDVKNLGADEVALFLEMYPEK